MVEACSPLILLLSIRPKHSPHILFWNPIFLISANLIVLHKAHNLFCIIVAVEQPPLPFTSILPELNLSRYSSPPPPPVAPAHSFTTDAMSLVAVHGVGLFHSYY
jgi:hypothetical protein